MCGRYTLIKLAQFTDLFPWVRPFGDPLPATPRYNIAPSQPIAVITNDGKNQIDYFRWGLVPSWAKDPAIGNRMINARAETLATKPSFRAALKRHRCLIPTDGFYEWKREPGSKNKTPMYIRMKSGKPFAFAGLWDIWHSPDGSELPTCTIITGEPNEVVRPIHNRMPVIMRPEHYQQWLAPGDQDTDRMSSLLTTYPAVEMEASPVGTIVNNPSAETHQCIEPMTAPPPVKLIDNPNHSTDPGRHGPAQREGETAPRPHHRKRQDDSPGLFGDVTLPD